MDLAERSWARGDVWRSGRVTADRVGGEGGCAEDPDCGSTQEDRPNPGTDLSAERPGEAYDKTEGKAARHREVGDLHPASRAERQSADRVTYRRVAVPSHALNQKATDEQRTGNEPASQQETIVNVHDHFPPS